MTMQSTPIWTIDRLVQLFVENRDAMDALTKEHNERLQPYLEKKAALENAITDILNRNNAQSMRTEHGTAYRETAVSVTLDKEAGGRDLLLSYALQAAVRRALSAVEEGAGEAEAMGAAVAAAEWMLLDIKANKTGVEAFREATGNRLPPGVKIAEMTTVKVRRA